VGDQFNLQTDQIAFNRRRQMIGSPDFHPCGYFAIRSIVARQHGSLRAFASFRSGTKATLSRRVLVVAARLRRFANERVEAAIAHHAQQASLIAQQQHDHMQFDGTRIYHGPADLLFAWVVGRFRKRPPEQT
jgi:hypothetical protein